MKTDALLPLTLLPVRMEQYTHVLANIDAYAAALKSLLYNPKRVVAEQRVGVNGRWGYNPFAVKDDELDAILGAHLRGQRTLGFYAYGTEMLSRWLCVDIDLQGTLLDDSTVEKVLEALRIVQSRLRELKVPNDSIFFEFSGGKGFHVWIIIQEIETNYARRFWGVFLAGLPVLPHGVALDLFPHPATDPASNPHGHLVRVPLGLHRKVGRFSCLIDSAGNEVAEPLSALLSLKRWELPKGLPELPTIPTVRIKRTPGRSRAKPANPAEAVAQPAYTLALNDLLENCEFMREFCSRPDLASYHSWTQAGLLLSHLGEDGQDWFAYLSSQDAARFDGSHEDIIDKVGSGELRPPTCQTIGCTLCDATHPLQHVRRCHSSHVVLPGTAPVLESILFEELSKTLEQRITEAIHGNEGNDSETPSGHRQDADNLRDNP